MSKGTVTPRPYARKATHEERHAIIDDFNAHNQGLDFDAIYRTIANRQDFIDRHVSPDDQSVVWHTMVADNPQYRAVMAAIYRSAVKDGVDALGVIIGLGVQLLTLAEARAARDIDELASQAAADGGRRVP